MIRKKENLFFLLLLAGQILILSGCAPRRDANFWGLAGFGLGLVADLILLYTLLWGAKREQRERELAELAHAEELERARNDALESGQEKLRRMEQDLEEKLSEIRAQIDQGETGMADEKLARFRDELDHTGPALWCQNRIVNAVMSEKEKECVQYGIALCANLMVPRTLKVEEFHLCSIFSNLLDNAVEAVKEQKKDRRRIEVDADMQENYLVVRVKNPCEESYALRDRRLGRGYGTQILENLTKSYEGSFRTDWEDGYFTASAAVKAV